RRDGREDDTGRGVQHEEAQHPEQRLLRPLPGAQSQFLTEPEQGDNLGRSPCVAAPFSWLLVRSILPPFLPILPHREHLDAAGVVPRWSQRPARPLPFLSRTLLTP